MRCYICKTTGKIERHHKDYNQKNNHRSNIANLCHECHTALHQINKKNNLDWEYLIRTKKKEIIKHAKS